MSKKLLPLFFLATCLLSGCAKSSSTANAYAIDVSPNNPIATTYLANINETSTHTYAITLINSNGPIGVLPDDYTISASSLNPPFRISQNNCHNVARGFACNISVQYSPTNKADYFNHQTLILSSNGATQTLKLTGVPPSVTVPLINYSSKRTGIDVSVGGGPRTTAMLDSGSALLVIEQSAMGKDYQASGQTVTVQYTNITATGPLYYANVSINGDPNLTTSRAAPIVVVPDGTLSGFNAKAVFGTKMDNQVSTKLFLPYPFNQMMEIDRHHQALSLGNLSTSQINSFTTVTLSETNCVNYDIRNLNSNHCWYDRGVPVTYTISGDTNSPAIFDTIFDSGEPNTTFYTASPPTWATVNSQGFLTAVITAELIVGSTHFTIPLTTTIARNVASTNTTRFNSGQLIFDTTKILLDQADGIVGLQVSS